MKWRIVRKTWLDTIYNIHGEDEPIQRESYQIQYRRRFWFWTNLDDFHYPYNLASFETKEAAQKYLDKLKEIKPRWFE